VIYYPESDMIGRCNPQEPPMSFSDLINKVESLLNLKADYEALKAASEAKIVELETNLAKYAGAPSNDDVDALNAKIDNTLNPPAPVAAEEPAAQ